jgi:hypothetical protein
MRTLGLAALIIALSATAPIRAAEITVEKIGPNTAIKIFGEINLGDDIVFANKTKTITNPAGVLIWLGSPGGILGSALTIATMVRDRGYSTVVSRYGGPCASACPLIWFSGQHAIIQRNSSLIFHMAYDVRSGRPSPEGIADVSNYLRTVGLTKAQADFLANAAAPSKGWVASEAAALALGFHYQELDTYQFLNSLENPCRAKFCLTRP